MEEPSVSPSSSPSSSPSVISTTDKGKFTSCWEWLKRHGGKGLEEGNMELKAGDSGIGCIALRDFAVGDTIMEVREMGEVYLWLCRWEGRRAETGF